MNRIVVCMIFITLFECWAYAQQERDAVSPVPEDTTQAENEKDAMATGTGEEQNAIVMKDIHDIKPPVKIGLDSTIYQYVVGMLVVMTMIVGLTAWLMRRKRKNKARAFITLSPDEIALNDLDELAEVEKYDGKKFYFCLSAILRNYLGSRYGFNAPEMTTEELMPMIDRLDTDRQLLRGLKSLMISSDPIKFAGIDAVENKMKSDLKFVRNFVNQTKLSVTKADH